MFILADPTADAPYCRCRYSFILCRCPWVRPVGVLILPPSRAPLGVSFFCGFCSLLWVLPCGRSGLGCQPSPPRVAVSPAVICLSRCHHPLRGCHPVYSWLSLVLPEYFSLQKHLLMHDLGHIISVVSRSHWVFRVLQQTPSSWRPDRGWSDPGLCHSTAPTALPSSTRAIWKLFLLPPRCCLWLVFG